ncbi:exo-beta-N-acetylmuramidase NamZ domain-containing protein [Chitinophaga sp. GCM10012297]|uniref:DUF1343 domain-containing protein n=1 Tax=Chitinophaga chungangae TaxID=2821488 RepID=A0ABS3Y929_9BACT|nr:DUF1343 domain-containing protein [Chitinophaga chungangae]MBO9151175.1 DUF1343 domain-containing protein [Chitinophaga chungangae]
MRIFVCILLLTSCLTAFSQKTPPVVTGAQRTEAYMSFLEGRRVGMLVNQTSVIAPGMHLVDSLLKRRVNIVKIFSPEHGFRGQADAGEKVNNSTDEKTGIPIISLYGKHRKADSTDLADVDVLVFDVQDVGTRFYTYISTLQELMESAAENHKPLIVLDRPNPNGFAVSGPVLDTAFRSFVGMQPIPIMHGMTVGEYAKMLNGEGWLSNKAQCDLTVITCQHYDRRLPFGYEITIPPSPNLRTMNAIHLYPGLCLLEGTAVSMGRGTDKPFEVYGHPSFPKNLYSFTPRSTPGAKSPVLKGSVCYGYDLSVPRKAMVAGVDLQYLLNAYKLFPDKDKFFNAFFNKLAGNAELQAQIKAGKSASAIYKSWQPGLKAFRKIRKKYLLYPDISKL